MHELLGARTLPLVARSHEPNKPNEPNEPNEPSASNDDHELGQVSKEGGNDSSKQRTTTTKLVTKKKVKRYLHRIVQIVVVVASAAVIITNWIAYSSYATIGVTPLEEHEETIQTLWLVQAICATIVTPDRRFR